MKNSPGIQRSIFTNLLPRFWTHVAMWGAKLDWTLSSKLNNLLLLLYPFIGGKKK